MDAIEKKTNNQIDVFEKKLFRNKLFNSFQINKKTESLRENVIGLFYNEFNDNQKVYLSYTRFSRPCSTEIEDQSFLASFIQANFKKHF